MLFHVVIIILFGPISNDPCLQQKPFICSRVNPEKDHKKIPTYNLNIDR